MIDLKPTSAYQSVAGIVKNMNHSKVSESNTTNSFGPKTNNVLIDTHLDIFANTSQRSSLNKMLNVNNSLHIQKELTEH